jgi:GT2 family glycosyltransferase
VPPVTGKDVLVSIVNHRNRELLLACLRSLEADPNADRLDIAVLDNASGDGSVEAVTAAGFAHVRLLPQTVRRGFGANHNIILRASAAPYAFILNDDTEVGPGVIDALVAVLESDPAIGIVGPRIVGPDGVQERSAWRFPTVANAALHIVTGTESGRSTTGDVGYLSGCAMLVRRSALDRVGLFDEDFFMYAEEKDLCRRLADAGYRRVYVPAVSVLHYGGTSSASVTDRRANEFWRAQRRYLAKHHSAAGRVLIEWQTAAQRVALAAGFAVLRRVPRRFHRRHVDPALPAALLRQARLAVGRRDPGPGLAELADEFNADG